VVRANQFLRILVLSAMTAAMLAAPAAAQLDAPAARVEVDLELVLAVDISRSMDFDEQELQRAGYVEAFRHPGVIAAIGAGLTGRIAVTYLEWAGPGAHVHVVPWTLIDGEKSAHAFADAMAAAPIGRERRTSISSGLIMAASILADSPYAGLRKVIDVSGDGPNNTGPPVLEARQIVLDLGITINGLPITLRPGGGLYNVADLDIYYENCVIGGPGAFLITVESLDRFALAIRRKLMLEIAGATPQPVLAAATRIQTNTMQGAYDCLIGEKLRERRMREFE